MKVFVKHLLDSFFISHLIIRIDDEAPKKSDFTETPGCTLTGSFQNPMDCFSLFFDDEVWQFLADNTNQYATETLMNRQVSDNNVYGFLNSSITLKFADFPKIFVCHLGACDSG